MKTVSGKAVRHKVA